MNLLSPTNGTSPTVIEPLAPLIVHMSAFDPRACQWYRNAKNFTIFAELKAMQLTMSNIISIGSESFSRLVSDYRSLLFKVYIAFQRPTPRCDVITSVIHEISADDVMTSTAVYNWHRLMMMACMQISETRTRKQMLAGGSANVDRGGAESFSSWIERKKTYIIGNYNALSLDISLHLSTIARLAMAVWRVAMAYNRRNCLCYSCVA